MIKKISIVLISLLIGLILMSSGFGLWQKSITIEGEIWVKPDNNIIESLENKINEKYKELDLLLEEQRIKEEEEKKKISAEQQRLDEVELEEDLDNDDGNFNVIDRKLVDSDDTELDKVENEEGLDIGEVIEMEANELDNIEKLDMEEIEDKN